MSQRENTQAMTLPTNCSLPMFVYGALKPGMPAYESIRRYVSGNPAQTYVAGELFVRDGLPLLFPDFAGSIRGFVICWHEGMEGDAYRTVCEFEPRNHYEWREIRPETGKLANVLVARYPRKGNPQPLEAPEWKLADDPAFGAGLKAVRQVNSEVSEKEERNWEQFFRAQMAYLLLWSILERLSALCFGAAHDPMKRINRLHELRGMDDLVRAHVKRPDRVSDSRNPKETCTLDATSAEKCFKYYYQVRSNLSHRGKAVHSEVDKVVKSLDELLSITDGYLQSIGALETET